MFVFFFHKGFVIASDCFKLLFILELLAFFFFLFIVLFYDLYAISKPTLQDTRETSLRSWLLREIIEHVNLDITMNESGPADSGPRGLGQLESVYVWFYLLAVLLFGLILPLPKSVHP